ncbi:MAG: hypothetical protein EPN93_16750 [Spirochaetes bacterium]|nr:MAG: hypothetical protein EPN93_16750 [Spirochaetota bacterium]
MDPESQYRKTLAGFCREFAVTVFDWPEFGRENALMHELVSEIMMSGIVERALVLKMGEAVARYAARVAALYSRDPHNSFLGVLNQRIMNLQDLIRTHLADS